MKEQKESEDVEMENKEEGKEWCGEEDWRRVQKFKKRTLVAQKSSLAKVRMNYLRWQVW